jgi:endonuclease G
MMDRLERAKRLKDMLPERHAVANRRNAGTRIDRLASVKAEQSGAFESLGVERQRPDTIQSGLEKLAENRHQDITPNEIFGLEAIVMRQNRPVLFVRGDSYDDVDEPWRSLNDAAVKTRLSALFPFIGRIELPTSPILPYAGTGFVVGKGLVATNRHVAQIFSQDLASPFSTAAVTAQSTSSDRWIPRRATAPPISPCVASR